MSPVQRAPPGVVGDLLVDKARDERGPHVEMARRGDPVAGQAVLFVRQSPHCRRIGLGGRLESGERALEEQLVPRRIGRAELEEPADPRHEDLGRVVALVGLSHPVGECVAASPNMAS